MRGLSLKLIQSQITTSPSWNDLIQQLPVDLNDYTSFLTSYSDTILAPTEDQLRIEDLFEDDLFEDDLFEDTKEEKTESMIAIADKQQPSNSQYYSSSACISLSNGEAPQTWRSTESAPSNTHETTVYQTSEHPGQLPRQETLWVDGAGRLVEEQPATSGRIEDISETDDDNEYLTRIEGEYAKREGGT
ncbi:hypothetical protein FKW77_002451 [Venturia effusa]|uniref:Uncharacterized protein n=1 Tax=Venturia effusa TaxID=50376 RepID=A0A517LAJ4_9PEZI|nr:hypothetical protein FKW77_002451 [Venturia effusa]